MRAIIVLVILALALIATVLLRKEREGSFDARFDAAETRIQEMARDIDQQIEADQDSDQPVD